MTYRPEIDGLRALAVLPVIAFHAGFSAFGGGFIGVDVFFVISGYLICSIILADLQAGHFSLRHFYERRARRILPALFLVMAVSVPLAWAWLMPDAMREFCASLVAVPLFVSNLLFWKSGGYFAQTASMTPLLHTWSLAVEEQFYLLFPWLLLLLARAGGRWVAVGLGLLCAASLAAAQWGAYHMPSANFFLLPTRGWELLLGAWLATAPADAFDRCASLLRELAAAAGVLLIGVAVVGFNEETPNPGLYTLAPTLGTALLLAFATRQTVTGRWLAHPLLVSIGLVSYSAYLWHQPLFAFAYHLNLDRPSPWLMAGLMLLSLALAWLSWALVERPFRGARRVSRRMLVGLAVAAAVGFVVIGVAGMKTSGFRSRIEIPPNVRWMSLGDALAHEGPVCTLAADVRYPGVSSCTFGAPDADKTLVLYGDSHAFALSRALDARMRQLGYRVINVHLDCGVIFEITDRPVLASARRYEACNRAFNQLLRLIADHHASTLLVTRWMTQLLPLPGIPERRTFDNGVGGVEHEDARLSTLAFNAAGNTSAGPAWKKAAVEKLIRGLAQASQVLYVSYPIPETGWDIFRINLDYYARHRALLPSLEVPYARYLQRNQFILQILEREVAAGANIVAVRPDIVLCQDIHAGRCMAQEGGVPYYYDDDHLSDAGAALVVEDFVKRLRPDNLAR